MRQGQKIALGLGAGIGLLFLLSSSKTGPGVYNFGGPNKGELNRQPQLLLPSFASRLNTLFARLSMQGFDPFLNEGYRDPGRAAQLATTGAGIEDSMHSYQAAADIKSFANNFNDPKFFVALGREAEGLGLTWGGRFSRVDNPHVQAVPVASQNMLRQLYRSNPAAADAFALQEMNRVQGLKRAA